MFVSLADQRLSLEEKTVEEGETPLTLAIKAGLVQNMKSLLEYGASPQNTNSKNESPLLLGNSLEPFSRRKIKIYQSLTRFSHQMHKFNILQSNAAVSNVLSSEKDISSLPDKFAICLK